jgi:hypothetical protein
MAAASLVTITGSNTGDIAGSLTLGPFSISGTVPLAVTRFSFTGAQFVTIGDTAGANNILIPAGAKGFVLVKPAGNVNTITIKGVTGDTGWLLDPILPDVISVVSGQKLGLLINVTTILDLVWY